MYNALISELRPLTNHTLLSSLSAIYLLTVENPISPLARERSIYHTIELSTLQWIDWPLPTPT